MSASFLNEEQERKVWAFAGELYAEQLVDSFIGTMPTGTLRITVGWRQRGIFRYFSSRVDLIQGW
jgi:hypothetical protein